MLATSYSTWKLLRMPDSSSYLLILLQCYGTKLQEMAEISNKEVGESCIKVSWDHLIIALGLLSAAVRSAGDRNFSPSYNADAFVHPLRIHITIIKPIDHKMPSSILGPLRNQIITIQLIDRKMPSSIIGQDIMHRIIKLLSDQYCSLDRTEMRNIGGHGMILIS